MDERTFTCRRCDATFQASPGRRKFCAECREADALERGKTPGRIYPRQNDPVAEKTCQQCGALKPAHEFWRDPKCADGLKGRCRDCERTVRRRARRPYVRTRTAVQRQRERQRAAKKAGRAPPPTAEEKRRRAAERAAARAIQAEARRVAIAQQRARSDQEVAEHYATIGQPWANPRLSWSERYRLRYRLDPDFNLRERLRLGEKARRRKRGICSWVVRKAVGKHTASPAIEKRLGYTITELRRHLERQFTRGMTWPLFTAGKIDIDHIVPLKLFDLSDSEQIRAAWALTNLRPAWPKDNNAKGCKRISLL